MSPRPFHLRKTRGLHKLSDAPPNDRAKSACEGLGRGVVFQEREYGRELSFHYISDLARSWGVDPFVVVDEARRLNDARTNRPGMPREERLIRDAWAYAKARLDVPCINDFIIARILGGRS